MKDVSYLAGMVQNKQVALGSLWSHNILVGLFKVSFHLPLQLWMYCREGLSDFFFFLLLVIEFITYTLMLNHMRIRYKNRYKF